jgi:intergrase/recombinase
LDWKQYSDWVYARYAVTYARIILPNPRKYMYLMMDVRQLDILKPTIRNNVIKSLIVLSKYLGISNQFKESLKNYGVKLHKQYSVESFLRILKASDSDILDWYVKAYDAVRNNEKLYLQFCKVIGVRKEEAINSFNLIIELAKQNKLSEYYNRELNCLMHFKYPKLFLRDTKNVYISFVPESLINQIVNSQPLTYPQIRKRLNHNKLTVRISELRDCFGTCLLQKGILEQEVNLLQGCIPVNVFIRHYWSPKLAELRDRIFKALEPLDVQQPIATTQ